MINLKNHPFGVEAFFQNSLVLTFAAPKFQLLQFIPNCLKLDTYENKWAFIAIAMVQTKTLRPKGFPKFMGHNFFLIGYRIFVHFTNHEGRRLRGLYIIKSETNNKTMEILGNFFTHYNYSTTDIEQTIDSNFRTILSNRSKIHVTIDQKNKAIKTPEKSPFKSWDIARRYAGPLPHTFTVYEEDKTILKILGIRNKWKPNPVKVVQYHFEFLDSLNLQNAILASAFEIKNVSYEWKKGEIEKWK